MVWGSSNGSRNLVNLVSSLFPLTISMAPLLTRSAVKSDDFFYKYRYSEATKNIKVGVNDILA